MEKLTVFLYLYLAAFIATQPHLLAFALVGRLLGGKIEEYGIFTGPKLFGFQLGGVTIRVNALPFGGFVKFADGFSDLSAWRKIIIVLSGCAALILIAILIFGASEGWNKVINGFPQMFWLTVAPFSSGKEIFATLFEFARTQTFLACIGLFAAKMAAFNLLPLGLLNGGEALKYLLQSFVNISEKAVERFSLISLLIMLLIYLIWTAALINFLLS